MISKNALEVLNRRYFLKDKDGNIIEDWEKLCRRVSKAVSKNDKKKEQDYFDLMYNLRFLPNSPTLMNAGTEMGALSACFVIPIKDNLISIMDAVKNAALIHQSGGGTGFDFSELRTSGSSVKSTQGVASGPISFMKIFNEATEQVKQGGKRRGANIALLRVDHPDILDFIICKQDTDKLINFNISVAITDKFMKALANDKDYDLIAPNTGEIVKSISAKKVFDSIIKNAWNNGEPGLVFINTMNKTNIYGEIRGVNPCSEQPLLPYESCDLGSINLSKYMSFDSFGDSNGVFDWSYLERSIRIAVRFLDDVISVNKFPLEIIKDKTEKTRKIGLGIMGLADVFIKMKIPYGSKKSFQIAEKIMKFIDDISKNESEKIGKEMGLCLATKELKLKRRNLYTTTIAPTGTISMIADCSSGCEPLYAIGYIKTCMDNTKLEYLYPMFIEEMEKSGIEITDSMKEQIFKDGSIQKIKDIPDSIKEVFVTAYDILPENHIKMQSYLQKHVDSAISKTINLPQSALQKDVREAYLLAYKLGCKGVTVYRDGSRPIQVLSTKKEEETKTRYRSKTTIGHTVKVKTPLGKLYSTINKNKEEDDEPIEVLLNLGKSGTSLDSFIEAIGRLISIGLKNKIPAHIIAKAIIGIKSEDVGFDGGKYSSIPDLVGKTILQYCKEKAELDDVAICPLCDAKLRVQEGCINCICGYSKC
jgi:ribonucleoside-diphosphate reductase alpha chain